jgi:hypothetical protein
MRPCAILEIRETLNEENRCQGRSRNQAERRYNGAAPAAELYAVDVMQMRRWSAAVAQPTSEGQAQTNETSVA